jgi:hypothetical protein
MTIMTEVRSYRECEKDVFRAARYAGHSNAMNVNLLMARDPERAMIWQAEHDAWRRRMDRAVADTATRAKDLIKLGNETIGITYANNVAIGKEQL